uniref:Uncharacterized protein n=1 Tax=Acrobeloides nanus TaxID=290746 RepID=A0A914D6G1_9BILA
LKRSSEQYSTRAIKPMAKNPRRRCRDPQHQSQYQHEYQSNEPRKPDEVIPASS